MILFAVCLPYPAAWSELVQPDGETVVMKIFETEKIIQSHQLTPGTLLTDGKTYIHVAAADGFIGIRALQLPGKKRLKTDELFAWIPVDGRIQSEIVTSYKLQVLCRVTARQLVACNLIIASNIVSFLKISFSLHIINYQI